MDSRNIADRELGIGSSSPLWSFVKHFVLVPPFLCTAMQRIPLQVAIV